jgi:hypothetical protein
MDNEPTLEIDSLGNKSWRLNGYYHCVDGPAIEFTDGHTQWWLNNKIHRVDGPAAEYTDGHKAQWWLNDKPYNFDDWLEANNFISEEEKVMLKLTYG